MGKMESWSTRIGLDNPEEVERLVWKEIRSNKWVEKTDTHWAKKYW